MASTYFWTNLAGVGTGSWDNVTTTHWSTSSGGSGGAGPPTAADTAIFDGNSGTGTCTIASTAACSVLTFGGSGITTLFSGGVTFGAVTVTAGTFVTGAQTHSFTSLASTSGTRTLTLTNSTINITGASGTAWNVSTAGTLTFTATGSTINLNGGTAGAGITYALGGATLTYGAVVITAVGSVSYAGANVASFSYTSSTNKTDILSLQGAGIVVNSGGSLTLAGNSTVNRAFVLSTVLGTARTITVPSGATVTCTNVDFQDITMAGTFSTGATASSIGDCLGNTFGWSSVQPDASVQQTINATGSVNWSSSSTWTGTTARVPLPQDDVVINYSGGTATTLTADMPRLGRNISFASFTKTCAFNSTANTFYGNWTFGTSGTYSGNQTITGQGRGAQTVTSNGQSFPSNTTFSPYGGSYTQQDNISIASGTLGFSNGTYADGGHNVTAIAFSSSPSGGPARTLNATGVWTLTSSAGQVWNTSSTGFTITSLPSTINLTGTCSTTLTFNGSGFTYNTLNWSSTASTGTLIITGANTFNSLQSSNATARTIQFPASTVTKIAAGGWQINGKNYTYITVNSSSAGTQATISSPFGGVANVNYLTIKDINATGGARWYAGGASTFTSNVSGWSLNGAGGLRHAGRQLAA